MEAEVRSLLIVGAVALAAVAVIAYEFWRDR